MKRQNGKRLIQISLIAAMSCIILFSCSGKNRIRSIEYSASDKRIAVLSELITMKSAVIDAAFDLYNVNMNPRTIPGATDIDYKVVILVSPENVAAWSVGKSLSSLSHDTSWVHLLAAENPGLRPGKKLAEYDFSNGQAYAVVYDNAVIALRWKSEELN